MGDEAFQTKKNAPTHISLRCLEQAVCCIMYCNSGLNFPHSPADVTSDDAECVSSTAWIQEEEEARWTQTSVCAVWILLRPKNDRPPHSPLKSNLKKKTKALSRAGLADGCSYPNGRRVTIESYLLILPYVPLMNGGAISLPYLHSITLTFVLHATSFSTPLL